MYVKEIRLENIRSIRNLVIGLPPDRLAGWHVLLGNNGSGKTSVLRCIALCLLGEKAAIALDPGPWYDFVSLNEQEATAELVLNSVTDATGQADSVPHTPDKTRRITTGLKFGQNGSFDSDTGEGILELIEGTLEQLEPEGRDSEKLNSVFSASYGPYRRFSGGADAYGVEKAKSPWIARHLTLFDEGVSLPGTLDWLRKLRFQELEALEKTGNGAQNAKPEAQQPLTYIRAFINESGLMPQGVKMDEVTSNFVYFRDPSGNVIHVEKLSDGYRSVLSMILDLIRQLVRTYSPERLFSNSSPMVIQEPGIVLIDEPDIHLHPTWQRVLGKKFRELFPNMQFIVATHSPLICQSAEVGTIWRLPDPGTKEEVRMADEMEHKRIVYGNVLEAYGTGFWGHGVSRSDESQELLDRLARLNRKELDEGLSEVEEQEQDDLRAILPSTPAAGILDGADHTEC